MPKINKKARLRSKADNLWFRFLLNAYCEVCGKGAIQVHHYFHKGSFGHLRYDLLNGISLCRSCHFVLHSQDPKKIEYLIIKKRGKEWLANLEEKAYNPNPNYRTTLTYYQDVIENLLKKQLE